MSKYKWSDEYDTGFKIIDDQHKVFLEILNDMYDFVENGSIKEKTKFDEIVQRLVKYAQKHFRMEEAHFQVTDYPDTNSHINQHKNFEQDLTKLLELTKSEGFIPDKALVRMGVKWLFEHINHHDKEMAKYLIKKV